MTRPSDRLDEELENWHASQYDRQIRAGSRLVPLPLETQPSSKGLPQQTQTDQDEMLNALLETARRIEALPTLRPGASFSQRLGRQVQARAAAMRRANGSSPSALAESRHQLRFALSGWMRVHPGLAAVVALLAVMGVLGVVGVVGAQASDPGNPFYQVKRFEQSIQLSFANPADRVRLNIGYARSDLQALSSYAQQGDDANYERILGYLNQETSHAENDLKAVPAGAEYTQLAQQLAQVQQDEQQTLRALLKRLDITERLNTTDALRTLGASVPAITKVVLRVDEDNRATVVISGSGFEPGAALLVDGRVMPAEVTVQQQEFTAIVALPPGALPTQFGIVNPDGTAVQIPLTQLTGETPTTQPTGEPTHTPDEGPSPTPPGSGDHNTPTPGPETTGTPGPHP
jgi:hypothetical protein